MSLETLKSGPTIKQNRQSDRINIAKNKSNNVIDLTDSRRFDDAEQNERLVIFIQEDGNGAYICLISK